MENKNTVKMYLDKFFYMTDEQLFKLKPIDIKVRGIYNFDNFKAELKRVIAEDLNYTYNPSTGICKVTYKKVEMDYKYSKALEVYAALIDIGFEHIVEAFKSDISNNPSLIKFFQLKEEEDSRDDKLKDEYKMYDINEYDIIVYRHGEKSMYDNLLKKFESNIIAYVDLADIDELRDLDYVDEKILYCTISSKTLYVGANLEDLKNKL